MATAMEEKSAEQLRQEIELLNQQRREITERLRGPRGLRKAGPAGPNTRNIGTGFLRGGGLPQRGIVGHGEQFHFDEQPFKKKRLLSAIVKVYGTEEGVESKEAGGEQAEENGSEGLQDGQTDLGSKLQQKLEEQKTESKEQEFQVKEPAPRIFPKIEDPSLAKRNRRMFGALLGTLEKFRREDKMMASSEAFLRRSDLLRRAEEKAKEERARLWQQEREELAKKRKRDLILRARLTAKTEEKQLELLYIQWTQHYLKLASFLRTKSEPCIFYMPAKLSDKDLELLQERQMEFTEWKRLRREEISTYQSLTSKEHLESVEQDIERWQAGTRHNDTTGLISQTQVEGIQVDETFKDGKLARRSVVENLEDGEGEDEDDDDEGIDDVLDIGGSVEVACA